MAIFKVFFMFWKKWSIDSGWNAIVTGVLTGTAVTIFCLNDNAPSQFDQPHLVDRRSTELARGNVILQIQYIIVLQILYKVNLLIVHITIIQIVQIIYSLPFKKLRSTILTL